MKSMVWMLLHWCIAGIYQAVAWLIMSHRSPRQSGCRILKGHLWAFTSVSVHISMRHTSLNVPPSEQKSQKKTEDIQLLPLVVPPNQTERMLGICLQRHWLACRVYSQGMPFTHIHTLVCAYIHTCMWPGFPDKNLCVIYSAAGVQNHSPADLCEVAMVHVPHIWATRNLI